MRILVVDDDPIFLDLVAASLKQKGLPDLTLAASAEIALNVIKAQEVPFDCVLLDIVMPGIDGIELCGLLRQSHEYRATPIIMITATQALENMDRAFEAGATDFLRKPLDDIDLTGRIHTAMLLVDAMRNVRKSRVALHAVLDHGSDYDLVDASKRICFPDAEGMLDYYQLENKLLQLAEGNYQAVLYRIEIKEVFGKRKRHQPPKAVGILHTVSKALGDIQPEKPLWYSYIGAGRFLCCVVGRLPISSPPLRERLDGSVKQACEKAKHLRLGTFSISMKLLNEQRVTSRSALLSLVRKEYQSASASMLHVLPDISVLEDNIFAQVSDFMDSNS